MLSHNEFQCELRLGGPAAAAATRCATPMIKFAALVRSALQPEAPPKENSGSPAQLIKPLQAGAGAGDALP